jgi:hypothetical protein
MNETSQLKPLLVRMFCPEVTNVKIFRRFQLASLIIRLIYLASWQIGKLQHPIKSMSAQVCTYVEQKPVLKSFFKSGKAPTLRLQEK